MAQFHKTPQRESGPFKKSQNLLTVDIDDQGATDFSASYLDMEVMFKSPAAGNPYYTGVVNLGNPLTGASYSGAAMLKNIRLESDGQGLVEEVRFQNRHSQTMRKFLMTEQENIASTIRGENTVKLDPVTNRGHIHIPLGDVLGCGNQVYPNAKMGMSRLKMELEDQVTWAYNNAQPDVFLPANSMTFATIAQGALPTNSITTVQLFRSLAEAQVYFQPGKNYTIRQTGAAAPGTGSAVQITGVTCAGTVALPATADVTLAQTFTAAAQPADVTNISLEITTVNGGGYPCNNIAAGGAAGTTVMSVVVTGGVAIDANVPWVIGKTYNVGFNDSRAAPVAKFSVQVILVSKVAAGADLQLNFNSPIYTNTGTGADGLANVFVGNLGLKTPVADFEVYSCNLVNAKLITPPATAPFVFKSWVLEMVNIPATTDFRRQVMLDSTCDQVKLLMPLNNSLLSTRDTLVSYRNSIQSQDTTTQDITVDNTVNGSLYYDRLVSQLDGVRSLQPMNGSDEVVVIAEKVAPPMAGLNNVVEFRLAASNNLAIKSAYFFKRVAKQF